MKKGQGLSVNMLIIIAIGLAVLIISIMIFASKSRDANRTTEGCSLYNGKCQIATSEGTCQSGTRIFLGVCPTEGEICCTEG